MVLDEIIAGSIEGKHNHQTKLYNLSLDVINSVGYRYKLCYDERQDIISVVFITVLTKLHTLKNNKRYYGWLKKISVNTTLNYIKQDRRNNIEFNESYMSPEEECSSLYTDDLINKLRIEIEKLPRGYKEILKLYYFEGYKNQEIADIRNISINTSKTQLYRARKYLLNILIV